jgi:hypothetical protein
MGVTELAMIILAQQSPAFKIAMSALASKADVDGAAVQCSLYAKSRHPPHLLNHLVGGIQ